MKLFEKEKKGLNRTRLSGDLNLVTLDYQASIFS